MNIIPPEELLSKNAKLRIFGSDDSFIISNRRILSCFKCSTSNDKAPSFFLWILITSSCFCKSEIIDLQELAKTYAEEVQKPNDEAMDNVNNQIDNAINL